MQLALVPHPDHPPGKVRQVTVHLHRADDYTWFLSYVVEPADSLRVPNHRSERRDGLWRSTCFELFVKLGSEGYREFNFAPLGAWNAYSFSDWRKGMTPLSLKREPNLVDMRLDDRKAAFPERYELDVVLGMDAVTALPRKVSLAAVIEEKDGTKSYWALAHPQGEPNFHHPACFVLELPPS